MRSKTIQYILQGCENRKPVTGVKGQKNHLREMAGIVVSFILLMSVLPGYSQKKFLNYQILRNGNKVGTMHFSETTSGRIDSLKLESNVKTKLVSSFIVYVHEDAIFSNSILLQSSVYRQLNGNEKVNKQHRLDNGQYIISNKKKSKVMKTYPINYNMLSLYSREPENIGNVYSDNYETFLAIQKTDAHKYKISLPDGNYNYYYYKDGVLNLVEVHHSLYTANIVLVNN